MTGLIFSKRRAVNFLISCSCSNNLLSLRNCVTQLKLYTFEKLSSTIFCCLWASQTSVSPDQISTFSDIYRHKSPILTLYQLIRVTHSILGLVILPPQFCHQHHPLFTKELQHIMAWPLPFLQNLCHRDYGERRSIPARLLFAQGRVLEGATQKKVWSLALHRLTVHSTQRWKNWQGIKTEPINCITKENKG